MNCPYLYCSRFVYLPARLHFLFVYTGDLLSFSASPSIFFDQYINEVRAINSSASHRWTVSPDFHGLTFAFELLINATARRRIDRRLD